MTDNNSIFVLVELSDNSQVNPISLETLKAGRDLADHHDCGLVAVVMGKDTSKSIQELEDYNINFIYNLEQSGLADYHPEVWVPIISEIYEELKPKAVLFGHTLMTIDLAPRLSLKLEADLISDCVAIDFESDRLICTKPVYSSNILAKYALTSEPYLITVRSKSFDSIPKADSNKPEIVNISRDFELPAPKISVIERVIEADEGPELEDADIIVAGGRGMGGPEGFEMLHEFANTLKAAVGSSRPPVDLGWVPSKFQIGQTGAIVKPSLYFAVGISGAGQHITGMVDSKVVVAINENDDANIFKIADFGIVGDYEELIPSLNEAIKESISQI